MSALAYALVGFGVGFLLVASVLLAAVGSSRGSRAEEQRDREGGWRP